MTVLVNAVFDDPEQISGVSAFDATSAIVSFFEIPDFGVVTMEVTSTSNAVTVFQISSLGTFNFSNVRGVQVFVTNTLNDNYPMGQIDGSIALQTGNGTNAGTVNFEEVVEGRDDLNFPADFVGTNGSDVLFGDSDSNIILGLGGDDVLNGGIGADILDGGEGEDTASYEGGGRISINFETGFNSQGDEFTSIEVIRGSNSFISDVFIAPQMIDIYGMSGGDNFLNVDNSTGPQLILNGGAGYDNVHFQPGVASVVNMNDQSQNLGAAQGIAFEDIEAFFFSDIEGNEFYGDDESYSLHFDDGNDAAFLGGGSDFANAGGGNDNLNGGAGNDTLSGGADADILNGGAGNDSLSGGSDSDTLNGGNGNDHLNGWSGGDELSGRNGNDTQTGGGGADVFLYVDANEGTDIITDFTEGEDIIDLRLASVTGFAGMGIDTTTSPGDTILTFGTTQITLEGFSGTLQTSDFLFLGSGTSGDDVLNGSRNDETFDGLAGNDLIFGKGGEDTLNGGADNDTLNGGRGNDTLNGDGGNDVLNGGQDNDILNGGAGNDTLIGLNDDDTYTGGAGDDIFVFNRTGDTDTVTDFAQGEDVLRLKPLGITGLGEITQTDVGGNLHVTFGTNTIVLEGLAGTTLVDGDFVFA